MTFEELDQELPNGFHDAKIRSVRVDFVARSIVMGMDLLAGLPDTRDPESYRPGTVSVTQAHMFFLAPPDPNYPVALHGAPVSASGVSVKCGDDAKVGALLQRIPQDSTAFVFFLDDWNSYLYVAGTTVQFSWDNDEAGSADLRR